MNGWNQSFDHGGHNAVAGELICMPLFIKSGHASTTSSTDKFDWSVKSGSLYANKYLYPIFFSLSIIVASVEP